MMAARDGGLQIPNKLYFRIGEVSEITGVQPYTLRHWEMEFPTLSPKKNDSGQRLYRKEDIEMVHTIQRLLHSEGVHHRGRPPPVEQEARAASGGPEASPSTPETRPAAPLAGRARSGDRGPRIDGPERQTARRLRPGGLESERSVGTWRSLVAHLLGVQVVVGSNPAVPTTKRFPDGAVQALLRVVNADCVRAPLPNRPALRAGIERGLHT